MSNEMLMARQAYGELLVELGKENNDVVVLDADLSQSTKTAKFAKVFPERFFNCGVAEQNMIGIAAGLAASGKTVFASTFSIFASGRAWDQIRNSVASSRQNVKIVVTHGGISVGPDGLSHQSIEDISLMRVIPNIKVIVPCDAPEAVASIRAAVSEKGPFYIRLGRPKVPTIWKGEKFEIGKAQIVQEGKDVSIIACGIMVNESVKALEKLKEKNISAEIINMSTVKPVDKDAIRKSVAKTGCVVTCEEHSVIGGLGAAVSEALCCDVCIPFQRIGVQDRFGQSGEPAELMIEYGLTADHIAEAAQNVIQIKTRKTCG